MTFKKINPSDLKQMSPNEMQDFKGGAGLCGNAEIFFPNNPLLNDFANYLAHLWQTYEVGKGTK